MLSVSPRILPVRRVARAAALCLVVVAGLATTSSRAAVIISMPPTISGAPNSTGFFDLTLQNTGPESLAFEAFSLQLTLGSSEVTFTDGTTATAAPYILAGNSFVETFAFPLAEIQPDGSLIASDFAVNPPLYKVVGPGTYGLIRVAYQIGSTAVTGVTVTSSVTPVYTVIPSAAVPEPSALVSAALGLAGLTSAALLRRRRRAAD